jgi:tetratricopeptide (TPR) repeat protein
LNGLNDSCYFTLKKVLKFCLNNPASSDHKLLLVAVYNNIGGYFAEVGKFDSSIYYHQKSVRLANTGAVTAAILPAFINLADVYMKRADYINSAFYFRKALYLSDSLNTLNKNGFNIYFGLGQVYMNLRDFELSDSYFNLAEKDLDSRNLNDKFVFCNNRGNYYYYSEDYQKALTWFKKTRDLVIQHNYQFAINLCELNMSDVYLHLDRLDSAQYFSDRSYKFFSGLKHYSALYYLATIKAGIALKQNNPTLANSFLKKYNDTTGIDVNMIGIRNKCLQDYYFETGDFKQAYQYLSKNTKFENSIQSERVKGRVAELDMRYKQDTTLLKRDLQIQEHHHEMDRMQMSRYMLIMAVLLVVIISVFVYFYMKKRNDMIQLQHHDKVNRLRLENAKNRVSPHFLFNCLNTIQDELSDKPDAGKRLTAIVKMLRSSLLNIENTAIPLKEEIEFVENYILLQKAKYISDLKAEINIGDTDLQDYKVPAMIIQIPVENAIKHGLAGKESGVKILKVNALRENGTLKISVADNGIGRELAGGDSKLKGTGTGLKVISQMLHLLNSKNEKKIEFSMIDLKNELGENCGTRVEIDVPLDFNYEI